MAAFSRNGKPVGLDAQYVGRLPCATCGIRSMKLPGQQGGLCIPCYADECATAGRRAATAGARWRPALWATLASRAGRGPWMRTAGRSGATRVRCRRLWPVPLPHKRGARTGEGKVILPSAPSDAERIGFDGRDEAAPDGGGDDEGRAFGHLGVPDGDEAGEVVGDLQAFAAVTIAVAALPPICGTQVKSFAGHFDSPQPLLR